MIVPRYWAEAKEKIQIDGRPMTLKRFGWSDVDLRQAEIHAKERLAEAIESKRSGKDVVPREPKAAYNGADGVPIREEIVSSHGETIITRNSYGSLCLNTPNVLFADVDIKPGHGLIGYGLAFLLVAVALQSIAWMLGWGNIFCIAAFLAMLLGPIFASVVYTFDERLRGDPSQRAMHLIEHFSRKNPDWHMRVYGTPAGWRVLVMHETFDARSDQVAKFFNAIKADWLYVRMCFNQNCFRARVSPKPWRVGMQMQLRPRPGIWPIATDRMPERERWVTEYQKLSQSFAACQFVQHLGSTQTCDAAREVQRLHDDLCQANSDLPIA